MGSGRGSASGSGSGEGRGSGRRAIGGVKYFISKDAVLIEKIEPTLHLEPLHLEPSIHLLPIYDEYIMGYKDRSAIFRYQELSKTVPPLKYDCMIIFNGQAIGTWKRTIKANFIELEYDFFVDIDEAQKTE
jgi:hypothetical protein